MDATPETFSTEVALRALARLQRREIVDELAATSGGTTLEQLEAALNETESTATNRGEPSAVQLHHVHLPLLDEVHIVDYDAGRRTVRRGPHFEAVLSLRRAIEAHEDELSTP